MYVCVCARVCMWRRQSSRFHSQSGSISSGRPQSQTLRVRLPTVGTSRDDCPCWGDCACVLTYTCTLTVRSTHTTARADVRIHIHNEMPHSLTHTQTLATLENVHIHGHTHMHTHIHTCALYIHIMCLCSVTHGTRMYICNATCVVLWRTFTWTRHTQIPPVQHTWAGRELRAQHCGFDA